MDILNAIFLGILQGLTEFFPVSSSGHLQLFHALHFSVNLDDNNLLFDTLLHMGTLISVFIVLWHDVLDVFDGFLSICKDVWHKRFRFQTLNENQRLFLALVVATIPLVIVVLLKDTVESMFENLFVVGIGFVITGLLMVSLEKCSVGKYTKSNMPMVTAFFVGLCQMIAITPGISRSGATIFAGRTAGVTKEFAVRFSFLMSIPAILGAFVVQIPDMIGMTVSFWELLVYLVGFIFAILAGIFAIRFLKILVEKSKTRYFGYYCWVLAVITFVIAIRG